MKLNRLALTLPAAFAAAFCLAQPMPYASSRTTIRAGVLLIESQRVGLFPGVPANIAPHIWSNLDQDVGAKPASWTFDNPLGQTAMTFDARGRWLATPGGGPLPAAGTKLSKSDASYWEISLANSPNEVLTAFDVLSLSVNGTVSLNSIEREKLRRFIDQGGVLWIDLVNDNLGTTPIVLDLANGLPYGFDWLVSGLPIEANLNHPVMRSPNPISLSDLRRMDYRFAVGPIMTTTIDLTGLAVSPLLTWVTPDSKRLQPIAGNVAGRTVSAAQLGEGYLVVTSRGVTATLNLGYDPAQPPPRIPQLNRAFRGLVPVFDEAFGSAAKFAVNVISLATSYNTAGGGSRHSSGSAVTVGAPLGRRFTANAGGALFEVNKPAVLFKGYLVTTVGGRVTVYDANPSRDIDGNGDPDDGDPDPLGSGTDLVWQSPPLPLGGRFSAPTVVEVPDSAITNPVTGLIATDQIWVVDALSNVRIYDLNQPSSLGAGPLTTPIAPPGGVPVGGDASAPYAPTVHEGVVVIADSQASDMLGRVWIMDLNLGLPIVTSAAWSIRGVSAMNPAGASPTVGYIPILDNSVGLDRVVYVAHQPAASGSPRPASLTSLWLGARGEQPVRVAQLSPTIIRITTRASLQGLPVLFESPVGLYPSLGIKITLLKSNGDPFSLTEMLTVFTGSVSDPGTRGEINVELTGSPGLHDWDGTITPGDPSDDVGWRIDYTIDWGEAAAFGGVPPQSYIRGSLEFPDTVANNRRIIGGAALGPSGNLFIATAPPGLVGTGSTLFNLREEGRGEFRLVYRYDLYDALTFLVNEGTGVADTRSLPGTFVDEDELLTDLAFLDAPITSLRFVGGPAVRGDTVYCVAAGLKNGFIDTSVLMAFHANPGPIEFEIVGTDTGFTLVQPDVSRSTVKTAPTTFSTLRQNQFTAEPIAGQDKTRIILKSAMTATRGRIGDSISSSLPVIVRRSGQTDMVLEPERTVVSDRAFPANARGRFDPLVWFIVINGYQAITAPVVTGETLFLAGASLLPAVLVGVPGGPVVKNGLMYAFDSRISPSDEFLIVNSVRPWQQQLTMFRKASPAFADFIAADAVLWPQFRGARDFEDVRVRLLQAALPEPRAISLAVGGGTLAVTGDLNLYGYTRSDFYVVDEGRVSRFDPSGNPIWSTSQTLNAGRNQPVASASHGVRLSRPTRMYPDPSGTDGYWIVDSGNDRVALIDNAGRELRTITGFKLDPSFVPPGMGDSESKNLRDPRDLYVFESRRLAVDNPFSNPQPLELWRHVVIAEAGHNRIVELVDRFALDDSGRVLGRVSYVDLNSTKPGGIELAIGVLLWHTPEELTGKRFSYNSIATEYVDDGFGVKRRVVAFGFGNVEPGRATFGLDTEPQDLDVSSGFGGVVLYDGANSIVITEFDVPAIPAGAFLEETALGSGLYDFLSGPQVPVGRHKIAGLTSVTMRYVATALGARLSVMVTEATGVYELIQPDPLIPDVWAVNWMLPTKAYTSMRRPRIAAPFTVAQLGDNPLKFRPQYARRLDSGEVLVVNSYLGRLFDTPLFPLPDREFFGEVLLLDGRIGGSGLTPGYDVSRPNLGFNSLSVLYELPPVQGIRGIVRPVYAARN